MTDAQRLALVRSFHTAIYVVMASSTFLVAYAGVTGAHGLWLWPALALVGVESVVFIGNGLRCPLTAVATRLSSGSGPVSDTFFPEKVTRHTFCFFGPLILGGMGLLALRWWSNFS
ncbi:MAG TPA: hypothetical protein VN814_06545 [Caulobacteraceae bacterium]|nr:hypothetical protein [Caulobacteraceae bacterium]